LKYSIRLTATILAALCLFGCAGTPEVPADQTSSTEAQSAEQTTDAPRDFFLLTGEGADSFRIIRPDVHREDEVNGAVEIRKALTEISGDGYPISSDWEKGVTPPVDNDLYEILVGETNRVETAAAAAELPDYGYIIRIIGKKIVILGTGPDMTYLACLRFLSECAENAKAGDKVEVPYSLSVTEEMPRMGLSDYIKSGKKFTVSLTEVVHAEAFGDYCVGQGAASDGTYAYFVLRTRGDGDAVIAKYRLDNGSFVARSEPVHVFHGNDMTYDSAKNLLVISHGSSEGKILTTMNPDTMTVVEQSVSIPVGSGAITYSVEKNKYAISQGGKTLYIATPEFKVERSFSRTPTSGYTAQGMGSDEDFIYFPMSGSEDNILMTYTWTGEYVTDVHIPTTSESESMFWVNGNYYVSFYKSGSGAWLYRLDFTPAE